MVDTIDWLNYSQNNLLKLKAKSPERRVNVIDDTNSTILRTTYSYAQKLIAEGTHSYTTKSRLKSFINRESKIYRNSEAIKNLDFKNKKSKHKIIQDEESGKTIAAIWMKDKMVTITSRQIDPSTGRNMMKSGDMPMHTLRVLQFPKH